MKQTDNKLTFAWTADDSCTVTDAVSGDYLRMCASTNTYTGDLDEELVLYELNNLIEVFNIFSRKKNFLMKNPTSYSTNAIVIRDTGYFSWDFVEGNHYGYAKDNVLTIDWLFDTKKVSRCIYMMISMLNIHLGRLNPKTDIVRRIADCHLLVWVYSGHCVAVAEKNVEGMIMSNALIDGVYYESLIVDMSGERQLCSIYSLDTGALVFCCPIDNSILTYYKTGEEIMEKEE